MTKNRNWEFEPERLIEEIEARPLLYVTTLYEYSDKKAKYNAWQEAAKILSDNWDELRNDEKRERIRDVQAKWKHIRDNFRREYHQQLKEPDQSNRKKRKYRYYDRLTFLIPHMREGHGGNSGVQSSSQPANSIQEMNYEDYNQLSNLNETSRESDDEIMPEAGTIGYQETRSNNQNIGISSFEEKMINLLTKEMDVPDEDKTFCLSLVQSLKRMEDSRKLSAKIEILNVIRKFSTP